MMDFGTLVVYRSDDFENWEPVKTEEIPDWVKAPEVVYRMVDGEACQNTDEESGETWFVVKRVIYPHEEKVIAEAKARRIRRATKQQRILVDNGGSMVN